MKAVICREFGPIDKLEVGTLPSPDLEDHQVRVAVETASVNFMDLLMVQGGYQMKPPIPFVPGTDAAGEIVEVGALVRNLKVGQRVMCMDFFGAYSNEWALSEAKVHPLPDSVNYVQAAAHIGAYGTAYYALVERAGLKRGETLVVHGASGGLGLAAVEVGRVLGARVLGSVGSDGKKSIVREYGADDVFNYSTESVRDLMKGLNGGKGADVVFDVVGGSVFEQSLRGMNWGGRIMPVGFTSGQIPVIPANLPLLKGFSVVGVFYGAAFSIEPLLIRRMRETLLSWLAEGKIRPHIHQVLPLEEAVAGMKLLADRKATGKVVLAMKPQADSAYFSRVPENPRRRS